VAKKAIPQKAPGQQVAVHQPALPAPTSMLQVISQAVMDPRCDVEKMRALMDMQERIEERDSKKAFTVAFNALQAELPIINKDGKISHGEGTTARGNAKLNTRFATYPNLNRVVGPLLKKHGFTYSTSVEPDPSGAMIVISTLEHVAGHSRTTHFRITADTTGAKNNQQGWGSSQQYGMRYNMIALLNIVTEAREDADNDGFQKDDPITSAQLKELIKLADEVGADKAKFCEVMGVEAMPDIRQSQQPDFPGDR
jgi:hypothetical protein